MKKIKEESKKIVVYRDNKNNVQIKVDIDKDTVWLTQKEMGVLFGKDVKTINRHIINIYEEGELGKKSTISENEIVQREKGRLVHRNLNFYNLDAIISVGYRVNSKAGTAFRIWATNTLKKYLLKGFVLNEQRMLEQQKKEILKLQDTISIIYNKIKTPLLIGQEQELVGIIHRYTKSLSILRQYDHGLLKNIASGKNKFILEYDNCLMIIEQLAKELENRKELTELFGRQNSSEKLRGVIGALYQTFDKKDLYPTVEEKAAHLLYLIIKDHPFIDGNKRIASILFVYFLDKNLFLFNKNNEIKITDNMLATLALLVAISDFSEKDVMINLIINLIKT